MQKRFRLRKSSDFGRTFKEGKKLYSPHFVLYMRENALPHSRLGISVSKNYLKLATRRNRLRRIAKALFANEIMPDLKGWDFVLTSKGKRLDDNFTESIRELKNFIAELKNK